MMKPLMWAGLVSLSTAVVVGAQVAPQPGQAAGPDPAQPGMVTIRNSPQGTAIYDDRLNVARMTKDVRVTQTGEDFILYADDLTYNRTLNQARAKGSLRVETRDSTLRGDTLFADFNTKTLTFSGHVVIASHGEKDGIAPAKKGLRAEISHKPSTLTCDLALWDYEVHQGTATGNLKMVQADNQGTCEKVTFNEVQNVALLEGHVHFSDGKRRTLICNDLTVYIDADKVESKQPCTINFPRESEASATPGPNKVPPVTFGPAPVISPEDLKGFETPAPAEPAGAKPAAKGAVTATPAPAKP